MNIIISLLGGLGLFLYGMNLMGEGLQKSAGNRLKKIIELLTRNIFVGVLVGTIVTAIIQSSSATTVMVVGFVNAGLMGLNQAIGIIMGANIGTTITAQLVSLNLEGLAPITLGIGIILYLFSSNSKVKNIAEILLGFGILFTGMEFMKESVKPLAEFKGFTDSLVGFGQRPILGLLLGFGITAIVQSSSASMGMLIALASQGLIPLSSALPILYGQNIGTCVTSLISSIGANKNAKRAAIMHLLFNVIGTLVFLLLLNKPMVDIVTKINPDDVARQIANTHTIFNVVSVIILIPFAKLIVKLAIKIIPDNKGANENKTYLDDRILETPSIAFSNSINETIQMCNLSKECFKLSINGLFNGLNKDLEKALKVEININEYHKNLLRYLLKLQKQVITNDLVDDIDKLVNTVNDIKQIGDGCKNICELGNNVIESNIKFNKDIENSIKIMYEQVVKNCDDIIELMKDTNHNKAADIIIRENKINNIEKEIRTKYISNLNNNQNEIELGLISIELISNLERISNHCANIAKREV